MDQIEAIQKYMDAKDLNKTYYLIGASVEWSSM